MIAQKIVLESLIFSFWRWNDLDMLRVKKKKKTVQGEDRTKTAVECTLFSIKLE